MTTFDERDKAFENKYAHDKELQFKAIARRNKLLGLWAAEKLDINGKAAEDYAAQVVMADFEEVGDDDVLKKVLGDLVAAGVDMTRQQLRSHMDELLETAKNQIKGEIR